jgi:hypothetical protein
MSSCSTPPRDASSRPGLARWKLRGASCRPRVCMTTLRRSHLCSPAPRSPAALRGPWSRVAAPLLPPRRPAQRGAGGRRNRRAPNGSGPLEAQRRIASPTTDPAGGSSSRTFAAQRSTRLRQAGQPPRPGAAALRQTSRRTPSLARRTLRQQRHFFLFFQDKARTMGLVGLSFRVFPPDLLMVGGLANLWEVKGVGHSAIRRPPFALCHVPLFERLPRRAPRWGPAPLRGGPRRTASRALIAPGASYWPHSLACAPAT